MMRMISNTPPTKQNDARMHVSSKIRRSVPTTNHSFIPFSLGERGNACDFLRGLLVAVGRLTSTLAGFPCGWREAGERNESTMTTKRFSSFQHS
jgi:hypothetical protein